MSFLKTLLTPLVALIDKKADKSDIPVIPHIPRKLSELISDSSHRTVTDTEIRIWHAKSDFDGDYNSLANKPEIPANVVLYVEQNLSDSVKTQARTNIGAGTSNFSGSYNDLADKPSIPDEQVQSDWMDNDDASVTHIKNRPFYDGRSYTSMSVAKVPTASTEIIVAAETMYYGSTTGSSLTIPKGSMFKANMDQSGTYTLVSRRYKLKDVFQYVDIIGNPIFAYNYGTIENYDSMIAVDSGEPFCVISYNQTAKNEIISRNRYDTTVELFKIEGDYVPIGDEYIPDTIQRVGADVILTSSTDNSTKKFKLTVDDSGAITATEVTG